jgi:FeS assembly SUF system protein
MTDPAPASSPPEPSPASATSPASDDPTKVFERKLLEGRVIEAISQIYDPEIPVNIYELGLIYKIDVHDDRSVYVQMTLTAPACPVAGSLPGQVESKIETIPEVTKANVELVWDPPWSRDRMSEAAQLQLGLM